MPRVANPDAGVAFQVPRQFMERRRLLANAMSFINADMDRVCDDDPGYGFYYATIRM